MSFALGADDIPENSFRNRRAMRASTSNQHYAVGLNVE
jgi:hypothetical protein